MKILFTSDLYTTATNGVVTSVRALTEELEKRGHEIRILTLSENNKTRKEGNVYYMRSLSAEAVGTVLGTKAYQSAVKERGGGDRAHGKGEKRRALGLSDPPVLINLRRLTTEKNVDEILRSKNANRERSAFFYAYVLKCIKPMRR